jgi:2-oxoglutarate ferredoxin oxidoreductase subunit beta
MVENEILNADTHPLDTYLRPGRIPHIWCPGCSLGSVTTVAIEAIIDSKIPSKDIAIVSGIGCSGRAAGYLNFDSFHTTHGRALPFAIGLSVTDPNRKVIVISGDGDIASIGGNHLIHAARRNANITVLCINNFQYGMTGGQVGPTSYIGQYQTTAPYSNIEEPFNLPALAASCGATFVARWTALDVRRMRETFTEAILHKGFSFVEILGACPTTFGRRNQLRDGLTILENFRERTELHHNANVMDVQIVKDKPIIVGKFVDIQKPTLTDNLLRLQEMAKKAKPEL